MKNSIWIPHEASKLLQTKQSFSCCDTCWIWNYCQTSDLTACKLLMLQQFSVLRFKVVISIDTPICFKYHTFCLLSSRCPLAMRSLRSARLKTRNKPSHSAQKYDLKNWTPLKWVEVFSSCLSTCFVCLFGKSEWENNSFSLTYFY